MTEPISARVSAEQAIARAARATGADFSVLVETARRESAFNPAAQASTSSARGLFQFVESTWLDMVQRHGAEHGLGAYAAAIGTRNNRPYVTDPAVRRDILALRDNPEMAARMAGELTRENADYLGSRLGRAPQPSELYAAHVLGASGAARLIEASAQGAPDASALFPREAGVNHGLFYTDGAPVSASALMERFGLEGIGSAAAPSSRNPDVSGGAPMSPTLARALFEFALMPLISLDNSDQRSGERETARAAYTRAQSL